MSCGYIFAALLLLGSGLWLVKMGVHGQRTGNEPRCARCDYNLTGLPQDSKRCPECGRPFSEGQTVRGARRRRPLHITAGAVLMLTSWMPLVPPLRQVDWYRLQPTSWLIDDLDSASRGVWGRAWWEIERRDKAGQLSDRDWRLIVKYCLREQGKPAHVRTRPEITEDFGRMLLRGLLTPAEVQQLSDQCLILLKPRVRHTVEPGRDVPYEIPICDRMPNVPLSVSTDWLRVTFDETVLIDYRSTGRRHLMSDTLDWGFIKAPGAGQHTMTVDITYSLYCGLCCEPDDSYKVAESTHHGEWKVVIVEPARGSGVEPIVDPNLADTLRAMISIKPKPVGPDDLYLEANISGALPAPIAFRVLVKEKTWSEYRSMSPMVGKAHEECFCRSTTNIGELEWGDVCDVILRSSEEPVHRTLDQYAYWDGVIEFRDIEIER